MEAANTDKLKKERSAGIHLWTVVVFVLSLSLYLFSTSPVFVFDDNSEFIAAAHRLGITHAPGYPMFSLFGKLFSNLVPEIPYFGINIMAAFAAAGAVTLAFRLLFLMTGWWAPSMAGAAVLMVSRTFWGQAAQAEVYAANLFFFFLILNIMWGLKGDRTDSVRLAAVTFVFILSLLNHYTTTLVATVCVPYVLWIHRKRFKTVLTMLLPVIFIAVSVCSFWMYLPIRSAADPQIRWRDQSNFKGFVKHIYGVDRRTDAPPATWQEKQKHINFYIQLLGSQWTPWLLIFAIPGIAGLLIMHRGRGILIFLVWLVLFSGFIFLLNYLFGPRARYVVSVFHITSMSLVAVSVGLGAGIVFDGIRRLGLPWFPVFAIIIVLAGWSGLINREYADNSRNLLAVDYARNLLVNVGRDGVIFSHLETESFPIASLRAVSGKRKDIILYGNQGDNPDDVYTEDRFGTRSRAPESISDVEMFVLTGMRHSRPVYFTFRRKISEIPDVALHSNGLMYQVNPTLKKLAAHNPWDRIDMSGINIAYPNYDYITKNVISKYYVRKAERSLAEGDGVEARKLFEEILRFNPESRFLHADVAGIYTAIGQFDLAMKEYELALSVDSENVELSLDTVAIYNNLSFVYGRLGFQEKALAMMEKAVASAPDTPLFLINLGQTYWEMDQCPDAIETLEKALDLGHRSAAVFNILGICYEKIRLFPKAEMNYEKAIETDPGMPLPYRDYGIYNAYEANKPEKAIELLDRYLELAPEPEDKAEILVNLGFLNQQIDNHEMAAIRLKSAIVMGAADNPRRMAIIMGALARSSEETGRLQDAVDAYEQGVVAAYEYPPFYLQFAQFLMRTDGDPDKAYELLEAYLSAVPDAENRSFVEMLKDRINAKKNSGSGNSSSRTNAPVL